MSALYKSQAVLTLWPCGKPPRYLVRWVCLASSKPASTTPAGYRRLAVFPNLEASDVACGVVYHHLCTYLQIHTPFCLPLPLLLCHTVSLASES